MTTPVTSRPRTNTTCAASGRGILGNLDPTPVEFLRRKLEKYPYLTLKPDSLLAKAVILEYQSYSDPTTERPDWPETLCGYIERVAEQAAALEREAKAFNPRVRGVPDGRYKQDECITSSGIVEFSDNIVYKNIANAVSQPGTLSYAQCNTDDLIEDLYNVDWAGYFAANPFDISEEEIPEEIKEQIGEVTRVKALLDEAAAAQKEAFRTGNNRDSLFGLLINAPLEITGRILRETGGIVRDVGNAIGDVFGGIASGVKRVFGF